MSDKENENIDNGYSILLEETEIKKTKFNKYNRHTKVCEKFDKEKIKIKRNGKFINAYDYTQSGREGTEIYATLKKYNGNMELTQAEMKTAARELSGEISAIGDLRTVLDNKIKCNEIWENLNPKIKKEFNNNIDEFLANGENWAKNLVETEINKRKNKKEENKE